MNKNHSFPKFISLLWIIVLSGGGGLIFSSLARWSNYRIGHHHFSFSLFPFLLGVTLSFFGFALLATWLAKTIRAGQNKINHPVVKVFSLIPTSKLGFFSPFLIYYLTPLLHRYYLDNADFRFRLAALFFLPLIFFLILVLYHRWAISLEFPLTSKSIQFFSRFSSRQKVILLVLTAFIIYHLLAFILVAQGLSFSGDEPYYLLNTHSLLHDQDINLANNYAHQDYFHFYSQKDNPGFRLGIYARQGKKGPDYLYPINLFGVSLLVLPHYWLSHFFGGKWLVFLLKSSLALWAALLGGQLYLLVKEIWSDEKIALSIWLLSSFSAPILFYAVHIYPEIPIAFFSIFLYRKLRLANLSNRALVGYGLLLGLFPWFGLKYNIIFWAFFLLFLYHLYRRRASCSWRPGVFFSFFPLLSMVSFYLFIYSLYGSFSPFSVYEGVLTPEKFQALKTALLEYPLRMRIDSFLDYFLDQRDGLFLYAPFYFFSFLGLIEAWRHHRRQLMEILFISLPFLLNYAFFTHRQGYCPQGRVLTPLVWVGCLLTAYFLAYNRKRNYSFFFGLTAIVSLALSFVLIAHPHFLYQPTTHEFTSRPGDLFVFLSNLKIFLPAWLPSFIKTNNLNYWPNYVWLGGIIIFGLLYAFRGPKESRLKKRISASFPYLVFTFSLILITVLFTLYPQPALYPAQEFHYSNQSSLGFYFPFLRRDVVAKKEAEFYLHAPREYIFLFAAKKKLAEINLQLGSREGDYQVHLAFFDHHLYQGHQQQEIKEIIFRPQFALRWKNFYLYELKLKLKHLSEEPMKRFPYFVQIYPRR